ncbi:MAG: universal stress protein [Candidatus Obscuribacterales bacterium]
MRVLIPVDDMPYAYAALCTAMRRQWPPGTVFTLARVLESRYERTGLNSTEDIRHVEKLKSEAAALKEKVQIWVDRLADALEVENCEVDSVILQGEIDEQLAALANQQDIDYMLIGSHLRTPTERTWLGSVASSVTEAVTCSVEIVRPPKLHDMLHDEHFSTEQIDSIDFQPHKIVVATDFSENSIAAIKWLKKIEFTVEPEISVITVLPPMARKKSSLPLGQGAGGGRPPTLERDRLVTALTDMAQILTESIGATITGTEIHMGDDPASGILTYATRRNADMIVLGAHGQARVPDQSIGSSTRSVIDGAPCSVIAINARKSGAVSFGWQ